MDYEQVMLDKEKLKNKIMAGIQTYIVPTIKDMELARHGQESDAANDTAKKVSEMFDEVVTEPLADIIATSIDEYIKNAAITGQIITTGSPVTQQARIFSMPMYTMNGKIPNTLGIS